jgi:phosphopantothenoylcysteine decarboxylase/phosphopantothenate--cysteine ligase
MARLANKNILLIISGGIAAYKSLDLIRLIRKDGGNVRCILTKGGEHFVTPLSVSALSGSPAYTDLWSLKDETEMGHIRLSREADLIVIAPASADLLAKMAHGLADDLASTTLLASNKPVLVAPAMNPIMWENPATQSNVALLRQRGMKVIGPVSGEVACGEIGMGRMAEIEEIFESIASFFSAKPLEGTKAIVTSGPTYEPLDPVRFIGNRSSGKQGHAIASALAEAGANVTLVTGPVSLPDPAGVKTVHIETAQDMLGASLSALPADIAICAAAVADWRPMEPQDHKMKKRAGATPPAIALTENPDILKTLSHHPSRPALVIGFAAETENVEQAAQDKLVRKGGDWIIANQVGDKDHPVFGEDRTSVLVFQGSTQDAWKNLSKDEVAGRLVQKIIAHFKKDKDGSHHAPNLSEAAE